MNTRYSTFGSLGQLWTPMNAHSEVASREIKASVEGTCDASPHRWLVTEHESCLPQANSNSHPN